VRLVVHDRDGLPLDVCRSRPTNLTNLLLLCEGHHHAVHDDEFYLEPVGRQRWRFVHADGRDLLAVISPGDHAEARTPLDAAYLTDPAAPTTRWEGDRLDHDFGVSVVAEGRADAALDRTGQRPLLNSLDMLNRKWQLTVRGD
jgi:hypothetical protein